MDSWRLFVLELETLASLNLHLICISVIYHWVGNLKTFQFRINPNCIFRTSGEGVEETLIVQFGQQWMKSTTDALQDKKEDDDDPSQVAGLFDNPLALFGSKYK